MNHLLQAPQLWSIPSSTSVYNIAVVLQKGGPSFVLNSLEATINSRLEKGRGKMGEVFKIWGVGRLGGVLTSCWPKASTHKYAFTCITHTDFGLCTLQLHCYICL